MHNIFDIYLINFEKNANMFINMKYLKNILKNSFHFLD